jgi:uncharacterized protein YjbI with pentapeptide repeats/energy-coupling factor transporter ATP-binding protein EcfA2
MSIEAEDGTMAMVGRIGDRGGTVEGGRDDRGDIFPALVRCLIAGTVLGGLAGRLIAGLLGRADGALAMGSFGASVGTIMGLFVGLSLGIWRIGLPTAGPRPELESAPRRDAAPQLWDPWLDSGRDPDWMANQGQPEPHAIAAPPPVVEGSGTSTAARASVRPRVISPETGEAILLEDEIGAMIQAGRSGLVAITGGPGSGKTTALEHLAAILPPWATRHVRLVDHLDDRRALDALADELAAREAAAANRQLIILVPRHSSMLDKVSVYRLSAWGQDDLIEYLLAAHREKCQSVMDRLRASGDRGFLDGIPELWAVLLDRMASDASIGDVRTALRREFAERLDGRPDLRERIEDFCLEAIGRNSNSVLELPVSELPGAEADDGRLAIDLARLVRHRPMALLVAADRLAAFIGSGLLPRDPARRLLIPLVRETARRLAGNVQAIQHLIDWLSRSSCQPVHPLAASLLHAMTPGWHPEPDCLPRLEGAYLEGVAWSGLSLVKVDVRGADLRGADLSAANLEDAQADGAYLLRADLHGASLTRLRADWAHLCGADLRWVTADLARFCRANLTGASFIEANLWKADLRAAKIEDANFTGANLEDASLSGLKLRLARFDGARFGGADLRECDLEEMKLPDADFHAADLRGALLTGSRMPGANFLGADLRDAGLAEVDWPGACLRDADLRGATFHLGSSRNGLVGSTIACEGSRTGFYTDDYHDQDIKPAEEIRKANLRGADLSGAKIDDVDFYLVDLRDAQYTEEQAEHFRRCRAILDDRIR